METHVGRFSVHTVMQCDVAQTCSSGMIITTTSSSCCTSQHMCINVCNKPRMALNLFGNIYIDGLIIIVVALVIIVVALVIKI